MVISKETKKNIQDIFNRKKSINLRYCKTKLKNF